MLQPAEEGAVVTRQARVYGCVGVAAGRSKLVAFGKLALTSDTDGSIDFGACGTEPPEPGAYTLLVKWKKVRAELLAVAPAEPHRMIVRLRKPFREEP